MEQEKIENVLFEDEEFESLDEVLNIAKKTFGIKYLFPWQRLVIGNILDAEKDLKSGAIENLVNENPDDKNITDAYCLGRQIVLLPTGAGKSMCFLVPAVILEGATLIFYPLLALMSDQARRMKEAGIEAVVLKGGQTKEEREKAFEKIKNGAKVILANPEVLQNAALLDRLKKQRISHIAIDEAHCVSEWGDTFRPAYLELGRIIKELNVPLVTAFTATASPEVLSRISEILFEGNAHIVRGDSDRANIHYYVKYAWAKKKMATKLAMTERRPLLIFCGTRRKAEDMARELSACLESKGEAGSDIVKFYHAGLSKEEKSEIENWFFPKTDAILCVTCAFGMGIDKPDIRTVIHLEPSPTGESYIQEAGRGGRDRTIAKAILLWSREDSRKFDSFPKGSRQRVLKEFAEAKECRRQVLLDALGGEQAVCSGCDICIGKAENKDYTMPDVFDAEDAREVHKFVWNNRKWCTDVMVEEKIKSKWNEADRKIFGINIWTSGEIAEILDSLKKDGTVRDAGILWKGRLTAKKDMRNIIQQEQPLHRHQKHPLHPQQERQVLGPEQQ